MENKTLELTQKELELLKFSLKYDIELLEEQILNLSNENDKKDLEVELETRKSIYNKILKLIKEEK